LSMNNNDFPGEVVTFTPQSSVCPEWGSLSGGNERCDSKGLR